MFGVWFNVPLTDPDLAAMCDGCATKRRVG